MTKELQTSHCPTDETLAAWVDGRLSKEEAAALIEHASHCEDCIAAIDAANETFHTEGGNVVDVARARWQRSLVAAAAVLVLAVPAAFFIRSRQHDLVRELVEVAPRSTRTTEARLSGGFAWAPYRGSMRSGSDGIDTERLKLMGAAAEAIERARGDSAEEAQRAAALAMVLIERSDEAIAALAAETKRAPSSAAAWSDLAAAQYTSALSGRASLYPEALASANRALRIDPRFPEALFNRALILERLGIHGEARAAWQRYLSVDPSSPWADEAREHLARPTAEREGPSFETNRERLETAAAAGDAVVVGELVAPRRAGARVRRGRVPRALGGSGAEERSDGRSAVADDVARHRDRPGGDERRIAAPRRGAGGFRRCIASNAHRAGA